MRMRHFALIVLSLAGCGDTLDPGSLVTRSRVVGARVEVDGDPTRAWPAPGETATVRWIVANPDAAPPMAWALAVCLSTPDGLGCAAAPFASEAGSGEVPVAHIVVPAAEALGEATALRVIGIICADGSPDLSGETPACAGEAPTVTIVGLTVGLAVDGVGAPNRSPAIADDAVRLGDAPWVALEPSEEPALTGCASAPAAGSAALPIVHVTDEEVVVGVRARNEDREGFTTTAPDGSSAAKRESLQFSHFTTAGELDRQFSVIDGDDPTTAPAIEVTWRPIPEDADEPATIPATGLRVRFTLVLRDGRGGVDHTTRVACLIQ